MIYRLWRHLRPQRKRQFALLGGLMIVSAFAEVISLSAVIPFLSVLVSPEKLFAYDRVAFVAARFGVTSARDLVLPVTAAFGIAAVVAGVIRMLLLRLSTRVVFASSADLSSDVYRRTLYQPYEVHLSRNTSTIISAITHEVNAAAGVLMSLLILATAVILLAAVMGTLLTVDAEVAVTAAAAFGGSYLGMTLISRRRLRRNSKRIAQEQAQVVKALQEGLGGIRDVLLDGTQATYAHIYRKADMPLRLAHAENTYIAQSPRYVMESVGMVLIASIAYWITRKPDGISSALPTLGVLALGAQRVLPALQQIYSSWAGIAGAQASLAHVVEMLDQKVSPELLLSQPEPLRLSRSIRFESLRFRYSPRSAWVVDGVTLSISKGSRVGFVGTTGSGKTTLLDLLMGLLVPTGGGVFIDDIRLRGPIVRAWQRSIAHVPQAVFLADTTLAENIAFGLPVTEIDRPRMERAAELAQIADFINSRPDGYNAFVGERGIRLSGGQRQRIGIARALYKEASVLVLDEATSALDSATEDAVMDSVKNLEGGLTVLMVAHRLSTVRRCDLIVQLEHGQIVAMGTYDELMHSSSAFRRLATEST